MPNSSTPPCALASMFGPLARGYYVRQRYAPLWRPPPPPCFQSGSLPDTRGVTCVKVQKGSISRKRDFIPSSSKRADTTGAQSSRSRFCRSSSSCRESPSLYSAGSGTNSMSASAPASRSQCHRLNSVSVWYSFTVRPWTPSMCLAAIVWVVVYWLHRRSGLPNHLRSVSSGPSDHGHGEELSLISCAPAPAKKRAGQCKIAL